MKKHISLFLIPLMFVWLLPFYALGATDDITFEVHPESVILINMDNGDVLFEKNPDEQIPTASLAKIMTMLLASEKISEGTISNNDLVTISERAWRTQGSRMFLEVGREVAVEEIFKGIAIVSGNDASVAMAEHISGSVEEFVEEMNKKAQEIGMKDTTFISPHGLPSDGEHDLSTARDLAILAQYYMNKFPNNHEIHQMTSYTTPKEFHGGQDDIPQDNRNPLLGSYTGLTGLKTGWITGYANFIATAEIEDISIAAVVLGAESYSQREHTARQLLNYGFTQYEYVNKGLQGEDIGSIKVYRSSNVNQTRLELGSDVDFLIHVKDRENIVVVDEVPEHLKGSYKSGEKVGERIVTVGENEYRADIVTIEDIEPAGWLKSLLDSIALLVNWLISKIF